MDALGLSVLESKSMKFFDDFCRGLLNQRKKDAGGRASDFLNLMCKLLIYYNFYLSGIRKYQV